MYVSDNMPEIVLPAHAGMIPELLDARGHGIGAPRACGDDPVQNSVRNRDGKCSPRMRG